MQDHDEAMKNCYAYHDNQKFRKCLSFKAYFVSTKSNKYIPEQVRFSLDGSVLTVVLISKPIIHYVCTNTI